MENKNKEDIVPKSEKEINAFLELLNKNHAQVLKMLESGEAYIQDIRDKKGELQLVRIYRNNGELLYYENIRLLGDLESKFQPTDKPN